MCSVLDKLATKYDKIIQLHLNEFARLPWRNCFSQSEMEWCECLPL